jgi:hypothetical protein
MKWGKEGGARRGSVLPLTVGGEATWRWLVDDGGLRHSGGDVGAWDWRTGCTEVTESSGIVALCSSAFYRAERGSSGGGQ